MILTTIFNRVQDMPDIGTYHTEIAWVKSDDLHKKVLRVESDHGHEYGIRIPDTENLEQGTCFLVGDRKLLVLQVLPEKMIVVTPRTMEEMGTVAHFVGNQHKPIQIIDDQLYVLYDSVLEHQLREKGYDVAVEKKTIDLPFAHVDFSHRH